MSENTDPPWLAEAAEHARNAAHHFECGRFIPAPVIDWHAAARAVLLFAAQQPRPITDAMVEAGEAAIDNVLGPVMARPERMEHAQAGRIELRGRLARAALEAAEKAAR